MEFLIAALALATAVVADVGNETKRLALQNPDLAGGDMAGIIVPSRVKRNAIPGQKYRWPNAVVPYVIDPSLINQTALILTSFENYHKNTCVRFVPRVLQKNYIRFFAGEGCHSDVGMTGGEQPVSLGSGCHYVGSVVHQLGHALGFYNEHNRSDRDDYLYIFIGNVQPGMENKFSKLKPSQNILYTRFDYESIMILGNKAFSKNGYYTMEAKNGQRLLNPSEKQGMAQSDITRVNKMYGCS